MSDAMLPEGFRWTWQGDTVRVDLPEMTLTDAHVYEPVLSRADADRLADAISGHVASQRGAPKLARVVLVKDPRYADASVTKFRSKLSVSLIELSIEPAFAIENAAAASAPGAAGAPRSKVDAGAETDHSIEAQLEALSDEPAAPSGATPPPDAPPEKKRDRPDWRERFGKGKK